MKKILLSLLMLAALTTVSAADITFSHGNWQIVYLEARKAFRMQAARSGGDTYSTVIANSVPEATYTDTKGVGHKVSVADMTSVGYEVVDIDDGQFGAGKCHTFTFTKDGCDVKMHVKFYGYNANSYLLTELQLTSDSEIKSNYLAPVYTTTNYRVLVASANNRMLKVPYDNDGFVRYHRYKLSTSMTSYEVTAIYSGDDRHGLVIGSVDHDHWKSAIDVTGKDNSNIANLKVYSGVSTEETRDKIAHGMIRGTSISSARFYLDYNEDWRDGMDGFAKANNNVVAKNSTWTHGTPMGWQSWGVLAEKCNYTDVKEIAQYYDEVLQPGGFCNAQGNVILSLDASDGLSDAQRKELAANGVARQQFVGNYSTPFSLWWSEDDIDNYVGTINGVSYTVRDICIKCNGEPVRYDGAWALDPTHPKVKQDIVNFVNAASAMGIKYIKCDFVNAGMIQSDSYYKKGIYTAVEAYNEGMRYLASRAAAKGIFVALSIAPIFPYQYANSRRIACDTWGKIGQTEYSMNAISGGWWTSGLYQYNDPDHVVMIGTGDQSYNSEGENRARFTNAAIAGMVLVSDNFSTSNVAKRGNPATSKKRAQEIMLNSDINAIARLGVSFRPLYGCKEYQSNDDKAESFFVHRTDKYVYVAGFNYGNAVSTGSISLADIGVDASEVKEIKELWTGENVTFGESMSYRIPLKDARVYRLTLATSGIGNVNMENGADKVCEKWYNANGVQVSENVKGLKISNKGRKRL